MIENLGLLWEKATLEEQHELLNAMVEAVYLDLWANKSVVGIQPKTAFYPLFLAVQQDQNVTVFDPNESEEMIKANFCVVETGEGRTPP